MPEIISSNLIHIIWALVALAALFLGHYWSNLKADAAKGAAIAEADAKKIKAAAEVLGDGVESFLAKVSTRVKADFEAHKAKADAEAAKALAEAQKFEAAVEAAVAAKTAASAAAPAAPVV